MKSVRNALILMCALFFTNNAMAARHGFSGLQSHHFYSHRVIKNKHDGIRREQQAYRSLVKKHPKASVQNEQYLRHKDGKIAKDPLTKTGRRIDHVVIQNSRVVRKVETTSLSANKDAQIAKERRIMNSGGTHIKDRNTGKIIHSDKVSEVIRRR